MALLGTHKNRYNKKLARIRFAGALNRAEAITRVLQCQLALGCLSARQARACFQEPIEAEAVPFLGWDERLATCQAAIEQIEADEWHRKLAWHDLSSCDEKSHMSFHYWRWHGFLVRYAVATPRDARSSCAPPLVCVHGFGASAQQWDDLMEHMAERGHVSFAMDMLGFGHARKPPLTYTQYLWEQLVVDFVKQVVRRPAYIAGNSIGGYTAMSAAASLGKQSCAGLILLNSAGRMLTPSEEAAERLERGGRTLRQAMSEDGARILQPLNAPPKWLLELGGRALFAYLQPNISSICRQVYPNRPEMVDEFLTSNILRDSNDPGAINVLISGAKLPTPITKNELLERYGGRVLVCTGMNDPLGGGQARKRFEIYKAIYSTSSGSPHIPSGEIVAVALEAGHCPHDETPDAVADAVSSFMARV